VCDMFALIYCILTVIIGVLTAWAWGFHRVLDGIELKVPEIDATKSGVTGCSRLGKAALAAGLFDKRIAVTLPMCSGVQGAGPYRYSLSGQGENLENAVSTHLHKLAATVKKLAY
jgi:hypothetical protein